MDSSDEFENEHAGSSASGSSAYGIGALDHLIKRNIKKRLEKNYDSEGNSIEDKNFDEHNYFSYKLSESQIQNNVMEAYRKSIDITRVNSDEAITTVGEIRHKLGKPPSSVENSPKRDRKKRERDILTDINDDKEISDFNKKKLFKRPIRNRKGSIIKNNSKYNDSILSEENVNKIKLDTSKSKNNFIRSRSVNTSSTFTTNETSSSRCSANSRNKNNSENEFISIDSSMEASPIYKNMEVRPKPKKIDIYGQFINLEDGKILTDNDT